MPGYLARRLALSLVTLLLITAAVYAAVRLLPGAPTAGDDDEWLDRTRLSEPLAAGYLHWLADVARLDFGTSLSVQPGRPVGALVAEAFPFTLALGCLAIGLTLAVALPLGVLSAWRPDSLLSRAGGWALYALHALPAFWIALALQQSVAGALGLLPPIGAGPLAIGPTGAIGLLARSPYWILPTLAVTLGSLAFVIRFCRASLVEAVRQPYARAALARGAGAGRLLWGHALANSAVPLVSLLGLMLPGVVSGSVLVETIFALPGVGRLFFAAAARRDFPVLMAISLLTAAATVGANLLADLLYRAADPRLAAPGARLRNTGGGAGVGDVETAR